MKPSHSISIWHDGERLGLQIDDQVAYLPNTSRGLEALVALLKDRAVAVERTIGTRGKPTQHNLFELVAKAAQAQDEEKERERAAAAALLEELMGGDL